MGSRFRTECTGVHIHLLSLFYSLPLFSNFASVIVSDRLSFWYGPNYFVGSLAVPEHQVSQQWVEEQLPDVWNVKR